MAGFPAAVGVRTIPHRLLTKSQPVPPHLCGRWKKSRRSSRPVAQLPFRTYREIEKRATQAAWRSAADAPGRFDLMTIRCETTCGRVERFLIRRCAETL